MQSALNIQLMAGEARKVAGLIEQMASYRPDGFLRGGGGGEHGEGRLVGCGAGASGAHHV